jgi:RNase H-fold protein (predicted Holliday junction resolvase)
MGCWPYPVTTVRAGAEEIGALAAVVEEYQPVEVIVGFRGRWVEGRVRRRRRLGSGPGDWPGRSTYRCGWWMSD